MIQSPWDKIPNPKPKEYDEYRHHKTETAYCAYSFKELTEDIGIHLKEFYDPISPA